MVRTVVVGSKAGSTPASGMVDGVSGLGRNTLFALLCWVAGQVVSGSVVLLFRWYSVKWWFECGVLQITRVGLSGVLENRSGQSCPPEVEKDGHDAAGHWPTRCSRTPLKVVGIAA